MSEDKQAPQADACPNDNEGRPCKWEPASEDGSAESCAYCDGVGQLKSCPNDTEGRPCRWESADEERTIEYCVMCDREREFLGKDFKDKKITRLEREVRALREAVEHIYDMMESGREDLIMELCEKALATAGTENNKEK